MIARIVPWLVWGLAAAIAFSLGVGAGPVVWRHAAVPDGPPPVTGVAMATAPDSPEPAPILAFAPFGAVDTPAPALDRA